MTKKILVIVAHCDDETIGLGGTIKRHYNQGDKIFAVSMTDGVSSRSNSTIKDVKKRKNNSILASKCLGFVWKKQFSFKDNSMDQYPLIKIIKSIEKIKKSLMPDIVYTHSGSDLNIDHRIVFNAVLTAFRPQPEETCSELRVFEIPSSTDYSHRSINGLFNPNLFIDISSTWNDKEKALNKYGLEIKNEPHSRSIQGIKNLANLRGNQVGLKFAESFEIIRKIIR